MIPETASTNQKRIAVTGVNGFVGKHLARELVNNDICVIGIGREAGADPEIAKLLSDYVVADLTQTWPEKIEVDAVIHLAGLAAVGPSFDDPQTYINLNSAMLTHLAEHYLTQTKKPRLLVVSSGAIYDPNQAMPLTESSMIGFSSPYTVSKVLVENQCAYYRNRGLDCIIVRPFNHIGPGQLEGFLVPDVIQQLQTSDSLAVGNIATKRDYTDVRDIVRAYRLLATTPILNYDTYNACSGASVSGEEIIKLLKKATHKESTKTIIDETRVRPTDPADIYGDASRLKKDTNWEPKITLNQTLADSI